MLGDGSPKGDIGREVVAAVKEALKPFKPIMEQEDSGGNSIRTMTLDVETGLILIT